MLKAKNPELLSSSWGIKRAERIRKGLCTSCGKFLDGDIRLRTREKLRTCRKCRRHEAETQRDLRKSRQKKGLCNRCGKRRARKGIQTCLLCYEYCKAKAKEYNNKTFFHRKARNGTSGGYSVALAKTLWSLWKQQRGCCALTGIKLTRENAWLDHIVPVSRGGGNDRSNLRWLLNKVNQMKHSLLDEELFSLCESILIHRSS